MANLQRIKDIAEAKNIPLVDLADKVGISVQQLHVMVRTNSTKINTLEKIAHVLNVSVIEFFDESTIRNVTHGDNSPIGNNNIVGADPILTERIRSLEQQLQEKDARIADLKETISLLKSYRPAQ